MTSCKDHLECAASLIAAGIVLLGNAAAQQTPPPIPHHRPSRGRAQLRRPSTRVRPAAGPLVLTTEKDKQSYAIGLNVGKNLHRDGIDVDPKIVLRGLQDELAGGKILLTDDQIKTVLTDLQTQVRQKQEEKKLALGESNKKDGAAFLAANGNKRGGSDLTERAAIQGPGARDGRKALFYRHRGLQLPRDAARQY